MFQDIVLYQNTTGVSVVIDTFTDISVFSQLQVTLKKPDGSVITIATTIDPADNTRMKFVSASNHFDQVGVYKLQALADGILGESAVFEVRKGFA